MYYTDNDVFLADKVVLTNISVFFSDIITQFYDCFSNLKLTGLQTISSAATKNWGFLPEYNTVVVGFFFAKKKPEIEDIQF